MSVKQTTLDDFLAPSSESEDDEVGGPHPSLQKPSQKLPEMWSRVRSREQMPHERITVFDIEKDLAQDKVFKAVRETASR